MVKKNYLIFGLAIVFIGAVGAAALTIPQEIVRLLPASAPLFAAASKDAEKVSIKPGASNKPTAAAAGNPISSLNDSGEPDNSPAQISKIPIHVTYLFLFKRVTALEKKALEAEDKGKDASLYRHYYKNKAKITDEQNAALFKISKDCIAEVSKKDDEAKKIIDKARDKYPNGKIKSGEPLPTPPVELTVLEQQRNATVLQHLSLLRENFGEVDFIKFQQFVEQHITSQINSTDFTDKPRPRLLPETSSDPNVEQPKEQK